MVLLLNTRRKFYKVLAKCTMGRVAETCVERFAVSGFCESGISSYCLDVVLNRWKSFELAGSGSEKCLLGWFTGFDW